MKADQLNSTLRDLHDNVEQSMNILDNATSITEDSKEYMLLRHIYGELYEIYSIIGYFIDKR